MAEAESTSQRPQQQICSFSGCCEPARIKEQCSRHYKQNLHRQSMPHVSFEELARLQLPENQLEARTYGLEKKSVCRNCGIITSMLGHHVPYCPVKPQTARDYDRDNGGTLRSCVDCGNSFLAADPGKWASCKELCERCVKLRRSASGKASWSGEKAQPPARSKLVPE